MSSRERGFTLVEMLVVMVIAGILMTIGFLAMNSTKRAAYLKDTIAAGSVYSTAISQFQGNHQNNLPTAADMDGTRGPKNLMGVPYLGSAPDSVAGGRVGVSLDGSSNCGTTATAPSGAGSTQGWVSYCAETAPNYGIRVLAKGPQGWTAAQGAKLCWQGNTTKAPRCDNMHA